MGEGGKLGTRGIVNTRDPDPKVDKGPQKSTSKDSTFEEYLKQQQDEKKNGGTCNVVEKRSIAKPY